MNDGHGILFSCNMTYSAELRSLSDFMMLLEKALEAGSFTAQQKLRFCVAAEEIFVNIVNYAYPEKPAEIAVSLELMSNPTMLHLRFTDSGVPFNPLEHTLPDTALTAENRLPGGLGIFLARMGTTSLKYVRESDKNILTLLLYKENNLSC